MVYSTSVYKYFAEYASSDRASPNGKSLYPNLEHMKNGDANIIVGNELINLKELAIPKLG